MDSSSPSQVNFPLQRIKVFVFLFAVILTLGVLAFTYYRSSYQAPVAIIEPASVPVVTEVVVDEPRKTDFGTTLPTDFPTTIPLEAGVLMNQSYSRDYPEQKQLTAVFTSKDEMKKNYDLYADFLKQDRWVMMNTYEGEGVSSLYAAKEKDEINVTVSAGAAGGSEVSISVLKK